MHFFSDCCVSSAVESSSARMYTAGLRAVLSCTHIKITIFRGTLNKPINMYAINGVLHQYLTESGQVEEREVSVVDDEMRSIFLARLAEIDQELTQLEGTESWEQLRLIAHNMKGSGATFGFPELSKLGREVCDAIDNSQHDSLPRLEGKLIAEISKTLIRSG